MIRKIIKIDTEKCNGCGTCAVECPQQAIAMVAEFSGDRGVFPLKEGTR